MVFDTSGRPSTMLVAPNPEPYADIVTSEVVMKLTKLTLLISSLFLISP
jgi:hypothetical protein